MPIRTPDSTAIAEAVAALAAGALVGMPTETVYGLAGDATNAQAVARIFAAKGRPAFNPLIAHVPDLASAESEGVFDDRACALAKAFWPGPLTMVLPAQPGGTVCELARAGLPSIALRGPRHPIAQALLRAFGKPVAAPSANLSGRLSPTTAENVATDLGAHISVILDAGPSSVGVESTIVSVMPGEPVRLLRPGGIAREEIEALIGPLAAAQADHVDAPGMLASHYAPRAALRLNALDMSPGEAYLGFGPRAQAQILNLSPNGDLIEAASNLYTYLRRLDSLGAQTIAVAPIPTHGLGEAINDRLARAAAPRP
ncbi:MAG: L-threonylcarbamoyladenylate synthase [Caulobacterales bacterium]